MNGVCTTCTALGHVEGHHVAGRANDPFMVTVCLRCHLDYLTPWQRTSAMPLNRGASAHVQEWARYVGILHVFRLAAQNGGDERGAALTRLFEVSLLEMVGGEAPAPSVAFVPKARPTKPVAIESSLDNDQLILWVFFIVMRLALIMSYTYKGCAE